MIEFAINDADLRDGKSLAATRLSHRRIIAELRLGLPDTRIVLMTMSPAQGIRGTMRPWLSAHYAQYRDLAAELDLGLIDFYPRWLSLPRAMRGLEDDDLHPDPSVAAEIIVPILSKYLSALFGTTCSDQLNHSILKTGPIKELSHPPEALR